MRLTKDNEVVHAFTADRPDQPLGESILPKVRRAQLACLGSHGAQSTFRAGPEKSELVRDSRIG